MDFFEFMQNAKHESFPDEASWVEARRSVIGASDTAGIFGVGYASQSPVTIWSSKTGGEEAPIPPEERKRMDRGKRMEPVVVDEFANEYGKTIFEPGRFTIFYHKAIPWLGATLDRLTEDEDGLAIVEAKNNTSFARNDWRQEDPILKYNIQCQHQMAVTGLSRCYLIGLVGGDELFVKVIERDNVFICAMLQRLAEFWEYVDKKQIPPIDGSEATSMWIKSKYKGARGESVVLPDESVEWDRQLIDLKVQEALIKRARKEIENKFRAAIGDAEYGILPFSVGSYKLSIEEVKPYTVEAFTKRVLRRSSK